MQITFYGVRGSIPTPGPSTLRYGGNTPCVHLVIADGLDIILDAGSGIRDLGTRLAQSDTPLYLFLSHYHWDHIQGFPFFAPLYQSQRRINIVANGSVSAAESWGVASQLDGRHFPLRIADIAADLVHLEFNRSVIAEEPAIQISRLALNHPGGGYAYRFDYQGKSCVYATDNELNSAEAPPSNFAQWVEFCRDADLLIHDAQYRKADLPAKRGWGHSLAWHAADLALEAKVKTLALFHHDPGRSDEELDLLQGKVDSYMKADIGITDCVVAREGQTLAW